MNSIVIYFRILFVSLISVSLLLVSSCKKHNHADLAGPDEYYTCSMDPQVIENKAGNCPICHMKLIKVKRNNLKAGQLKLSSQQIRLGNIIVDTLREHVLAKEIVLTGKISINQNLTNAISSKVPGRIERLTVKTTGDYIRKGQLLYEIYSEELVIAQQEYILSIKKSTLSANLREASKNRLLLYGMSESQINNLKTTQQILNIVPVFSNYDGFVNEISVGEGSYISTGTTLFRLTPFNTLWVEAQVYMPYLNYIKIGTEALITVPAAGTLPFLGKVVFIDPQVQSSARFINARFQFSDSSHTIRPGMLANIILQTESKNTLALPINAVIQDSKGANVWIRNGNGDFENKMVTVGMQNSHQIEILEGLKVGDIVVIEGTYLLNSEYIFKKGTNPMEGHSSH